MYDPEDMFLARCNLAMVELEKVVDPGDVAELKDMIEEHDKLTGSTVAKAILSDWKTSLGRFHKVMPIEYRKALEKRAARAGGNVKQEVGHG